MTFNAWLASINDPAEKHDLFQPIYRARDGVSLLAVSHDLAALATVSGPAWRTRFDGRWGPHTNLRGASPQRALESKLNASGIWSKREWVLPQIPAEDVVTLGEGLTPLIESAALGHAIGSDDLAVKLCGNSHTGSFKDLGMTVLVSAVNHMRRRGQPIRAVACASTGDTSAALAAYAAAAGLPAVVLLPKDKISLAQLLQPLAHGALVLALETDFDGCMKVVQQLASDPEIYLANSMNSLRIEGQKTVGVEVTQQQGWHVPDWVVIPGGNLGNVSALAAGFDLMKTLGVIDRLPRIAVAQAERANPLYRAFRAGLTDATPVAPITAGDTQASAIRIGHPVSWDKAIRGIIATNGVVEQATEGELAEACATADRAGLYACPHTGVAIAATKKLLAAGTIRKSERVVIVSTAHGLKFTEQKLAYHEDQLAARFGVKAGQPNRPVDCAPTLDAVRRALDAHGARFPV